MEKIEALAKFLGIEPEEGEELEDLIDQSAYDEDEFDADGGTYLVLTDEEADERTEESIKELLWAFNTSFLCDNTGLPEEVFQALQPQYEDANATVFELVNKCGDFDELVSDAIASDGRGHFLSGYDGEENEEGGYYIYRTN